MKVSIILDDATQVHIKLYQLIEQKLREYHFDGQQDSNRKYTYYILIRQYNNLDEEWTNPFIHYESVEIKNLILHDYKHTMHLVMKISSLNKYEMDHLIDHLDLLFEGAGIYQVVRSNKQFYAKEGTPLLDFITFFRWTYD